MDFGDILHAVEGAAGAMLGMPTLGVNQAKVEATNPAPSFTQRLGATAESLGGLQAATGLVDKIAPLKFVLDLPNRTVDSFFNGIQSGNLPGDDASFAKGWANAWNNYGQASHLSAGELLGAQINSIGKTGPDPLAMDPTTTQGIQGLKQLAHGTWYGDIAGGASDVLAGFIGPGAAIGDAAKTARAAGEIQTMEQANQVAETLNSARAEGTLNSLKKGNSFFSQPTPNSLAARLNDSTAKMLDHGSSVTDSLDYLAPMMPNANEATKAILANINHVAWKIPNREYGQHVIANAYLAAMGSSAAMAELVKSEPLIANMLHEASGPPSFLADVATAQQMIIDARATGGDLRPDTIMQQVYDIPRKVAVREALSKQIDQATQDAIQLRGLRQRIASLKPVQRTRNPDKTYTDNFDTARLKETRGKAQQQVSSLNSQLADARADLKGVQRWSGAADKAVVKQGVTAADENPFKNSREFNQALGAAQQRVDTLTQQIAQAKADRDLLMQTPLQDSDAMAAWKSSMDNARKGTKQAVAKRDMLQAIYRVHNRGLRNDLKNMKAMRPGLDATNEFLADIDQLGQEGAAFVGRVAPTMLDAAKQAFREHVGKTYLYQTDPYTPNVLIHLLPSANKQLANIGTEYGLNRVQTLDRYRGSQELRMALRRSGVYTGDEIKAASDRFIKAAPAKVQMVVKSIHDEMLGRIAQSVGLDPEIGMKIIKDTNDTMGGIRTFMASALERADAKGNKIVHLSEFPSDEASGTPYAITSAQLRSHLQDTASFLDPYHARRLMKMAESPTGLNWSKLIESGDAALYVTNYLWKVAALARPGLFFRNLLDTGIRSMALMGMHGATMSAINGTVHKIRNDGIKVGNWATRPGTIRGDVLDRMGLQQPQNYAMRMLGDKGVDVPGWGKITLYDQTAEGRNTIQSIAASRQAMQRGAYVHNSLFSTQERITNQIHKKMAVWNPYEPGDPRWGEAYAEHLSAVMASPTMRAMMKDSLVPAPPGGFTPQEYVARLFKDPAVRAEYDTMGLPKNATPVQYIEQLHHEMDLMFPEPVQAQLIKDVLDGKVRGARGKQWIAENFPPGMQFRIPGPASILEKRHETLKNLMNAALNKSFSVLMDEPDFWLVRHPVAVQVFRQQAETELSHLMNARRAKFGEDARITEDDIRKIQARARTKAITTVRNYGYDTTHSTVFSQHIHRVAPFYNVFHDVLRAYSKLIYDDPQRLHLLSGLYNGPVNLSQWLPMPLVTDMSGTPLRPGEEPADGRRMYNLNALIGGRTPFGGVTLRVGQSSTNAILMSEVPWLPGWGPTLQIPVTAFFNSQQQLGLALSSSKNPVIQSIMKSFYPGGTIPKGDPLNLLKAFAPPVWRHVWDGYSGDTYWKNVQYGLNQAWINSQRTGEKFDFARALDKAESDANMANTVMLISQGVFGLSGDTSVEGHFYVNQMHILQGLTKAQLAAKGYPSVQAAFSAMFPEAAQLDWSFTQNDTGISATLNAQTAAHQDAKLIDQFPKLGWFIVGGENVAQGRPGDEFSQTAYNQQIVSGGRSVVDPQKQMDDTQAGFGWQEYTQYMTALRLFAQTNGLDDKTMAAMKAMEVNRLAKSNPVWYRAWNLDTGALKNFYNEADIISALPSMRDRQDMAMYREYRATQQALMDQAGLGALGSGRDSALIRYILNQYGEELSAQNFGFAQMWDRELSKDVTIRPTDARYNIGTGS